MVHSREFVARRLVESTPRLNTRLTLDPLRSRHNVPLSLTAKGARQPESAFHVCFIT